MDTLASLVASIGPMIEAEAVGWAIRLAKRVEALHRLGVAHGGISAEAIRAGGPSPQSLGVLADVREAPTVHGYYSPERQGATGVSTADDAWAIAVTLYFLLTGSLPFPGSNASEVRQRMTAPAPPLSVFGVDDDGLERLFERFLSRNPIQRVARVTAMRELLEGWSSDPSLRGLPPLEEGTSTAAPGDDEDDEDNAATQMRDVGDVQAILAQARALNAGQPQRAAGPGPDMRKGTLLGLARPPVAQPSTPAPTAAPAPPVAPPSPEARPLRQLQPTMRSLGVSPLASPVAAPVKFQDDDEGGGATLMLDAGPLDLSAAIEDALRKNGPPGGGSADTAPLPGGGSSDLGGLLAATRPSGASPLGETPNPVDQALAGGSAWASAAPPVPSPPAAPLAPASSEGRGLKIALAVGLVLLVVVVAAVAVLYMKTRAAHGS